MGFNSICNPSLGAAGGFLHAGITHPTWSSVTTSEVKTKLCGHGFTITKLNAWAAGIFYGSHCLKEDQAEVGEVTELAGVGWLQVTDGSYVAQNLLEHG